MPDLLAHGDGRLTTLNNDGKVFDLIYGDGTRRKWVEVAVPFVPVKLAVRGDGVTFAVASDGSLWQRLPDRREHAAGGVIEVTADWKQIAARPPQ